MSPDDPDDYGTRTDVQLDAPGIASRPTPRSPYLIVLSGSTSVGRSFKLQGEMVIGRVGADISLEDTGISRRHARVRVDADGAVVIEDLQSTNGTFLEDERIEVRKLEDGDKLRIGSTTILKLSYQDALEEALQKNLYESATRDPLTRVYNKKFLLEALEKEVAYSLRHQVPLSLVLLDVDHFKRVNDTWGHPAGDYVLVRLTQVILQIVRTEDIVARYGGEEFAIILRQTATPSAAACAERIRSGVEETEFIYEGHTIPVTISAGVAERSVHLADAEKLIRAADEMLYRAKSGGRNRIEAT